MDERPAPPRAAPAPSAAETVGYLDALSDRPPPVAPRPAPPPPRAAPVTQPAAPWPGEPPADAQVGGDDYERVVSGRAQRPIGAPAAEPEAAPTEAEPQKSPRPVLIALAVDAVLAVLLVVLVLVL